MIESFARSSGPPVPREDHNPGCMMWMAYSTRLQLLERRRRVLVMAIEHHLRAWWVALDRDLKVGRNRRRSRDVIFRHRKAPAASARTTIAKAAMLFPGNRRPFRPASGRETAEIFVHRRRRRITLLRDRPRTRESGPRSAAGPLPCPIASLVRINLWKIEPILPGADFVNDFAEAKNVGLRRARAFRRNISFSADE